MIELSLPLSAPFSLELLLLLLLNLLSQTQERLSPWSQANAQAPIWAPAARPASTQWAYLHVDVPVPSGVSQASVAFYSLSYVARQSCRHSKTSHHLQSQKVVHSVGHPLQHLFLGAPEPRDEQFAVNAHYAWTGAPARQGRGECHSLKVQT